MEFFDQMVLNPENITFTLLFVGLFIYTMKTNEKREEHYRETIRVLTDSLNECEATKVKLTGL